jgi:hypothetical protein
LIPTEVLRLRYEEIRRGVLAGPLGGGPLGNGAVVLLRQGMAAWMRAWCEGELRHSAYVQPGRVEGEGQLLPGVLAPEVVVVLAQMVLEASKEAR